MEKRIAKKHDKLKQHLEKWNSALGLVKALPLLIFVLFVCIA